MENLILVLKMVMYGVFGYYFSNIFFKDSKSVMYGVCLPSFSIFSLFSLLFRYDNIFLTFLMGVLGAYAVRVVVSIIYSNTVFNKNLLIFGILNIVNYYIINDFLKLLFDFSSALAIEVFALIIMPAFILDLSLSMRKLC